MIKLKDIIKESNRLNLYEQAKTYKSHEMRGTFIANYVTPNAEWEKDFAPIIRSQDLTFPKKLFLAPNLKVPTKRKSDIDNVNVTIVKIKVILLFNKDFKAKGRAFSCC